MARSDSASQRSLILLAVFLAHVGVILLAVRAGRQQMTAHADISNALIQLALSRPVVRLTSQTLPDLTGVKPDALRLPTFRSPADFTSPTVEPQPPSPAIDWEHEAQLAARSGLNSAAREQQYRNLAASLSPSQRSWIERNHMKAAGAGMVWKPPRVEVLPDGMPIIHVNEHCVIVPLLVLPMIFCSIGHIEPNGDLFEHLHDSSNP